MGMELTAQALRDIADKLEQLEKLDIEVSSFKCGFHTVVIKTVSTREGKGYAVQGVTTGLLSGPLLGVPKETRA